MMRRIVAASHKTISERKFQTLVSQFRRLRDSADSASVDSGLKTYWNYGDLIVAQNFDDAIGYHNSVLRDLSRETGISIRTLQRSVVFRQSYSSAPEGQGLAWSHYRVLVSLPSARQRNFYARLAKKERWSSKELQKAIGSDLYSGGKLTEPELTRPTELSYLYKAEQTRVIDGDTLGVLIDLGFEAFVLQRLRLAQIDAPEIDTPEGRATRNFLTEALADARTVVLTTHKSDLHGRYIAHVFSSPKKLTIDQCFQEGVHLNDLLVRSKHAHIVG